ncbi:MAG: bifunctional [glutamine synthetase] adenylyltransferase/[glutamine synthetase]-adenylyl-L-tyrosine phosphorylase [Hyphomicrobiaceae bacterium]|nr:bifunctional [glutamine synthetase] adenylyltransferase/[glutamine synthetase]-adenylyl-L-tyrosine phosphorylase [Hyphomicrobiaceae bacterium]MCC0025285.1 bifunctional [glutamine synthetase] adenylyltransferase/[glutamine synthetase]-adenylyl-L-tyrosine phosphorylase [Hyphomicrobiaceae bacterium]
MKALPALTGPLPPRLADAFPELAARDTPVWSSLCTIFKLSPFLADQAIREPVLVRFLAHDMDANAEFSKLIAEAKALALAPRPVEETGTALRLIRRRVALLAGIAEISGLWTTKRCTSALTEFADAAVEVALSSLLARQVEKGAFREGEAVNAGNCGLAIFALGKHGGGELNYSSDIDIVAFFDPDEAPLADPGEATKLYSRMVQNLGNLLTDRNENGYVFRTDLRLRPDPGSTPVAIPVDAALTYYEARGQNWERAAWIKARQCAGDHRVGDAFLKDLTPFIWRKHLDFATIADIQAMKRQINISKSVGGQRLAGHNVKLGRGGIREVEFFVQTQLLIAGGRDLGLRVKSTEAALQALSKAGWIDEKARAELSEAYWFLRAVENRLQMVGDQQTQDMPTEQDKLAGIAALMGFGTLDEFERAYLGALDCVSRNYANLFSEQGELSAAEGNLVFTGTDDDPATLDTLSRMGFAEPKRASATIRKWHYGGYAATRTAAARAHLTELMPILLTAVGSARNADATLERFDRFLARLPAGVQLFSLLRAHAELCQLLIALLAAAPRMADAVIRRAHVLDGLLDPSRSGEVVDPEVLREKVDHFLGQATSYEDLIDRARIVGQEQQFLISAGLVSGSINGQIAAGQFTVLAETLMMRLFADVQARFAEAHGRIADASVGLIGFGKLGSREMTARSDLDLILVYDVPQSLAQSDGARPLDAVTYFARLTQRFITALSAPTATGVLYEVDMRLRPSGNAGPVATSLTSFRDYQAGEAWTWEHLALSRARPICADPSFAETLDRAITEALGKDRDRSATLKDITDMRARMLRDRAARHPFDLKLADGGLVDLDFMAQSVVLLFGSERADVMAARRDIPALLEMLPQLIAGIDSGPLVEAYHLMSDVLQIMSASLAEPFNEDGWTDAFKDQLARLCNAPDFERLTDDIERAELAVRTGRDLWFARVGEVLGG